MKKFKRYALFLVLSLFLILSFVIPSLAATSSTNGNVVYSAGLPLDLFYENYTTGTTPASYSNISNSNVFISGGYNNTISASGYSPSFDFTFYWQSIAGQPDVRIVSKYLNGEARLKSFVTRDRFMIPRAQDTGIYPYILNDIGLSFFSMTDVNLSFKVTYTYQVIVPQVGTPSAAVLLFYDFEHDIPLSYTPYNHPTYGQGYTTTASIPNIQAEDLVDIEQMLLASDHDPNYCFVSQVSGAIDDFFLPAYFSQDITISDRVGIPRTIGVIYNYVNAMFRRLYNSGGVNVDFEDIHWSDFLKNSLDGFMNLEIVPGISLGALFGTIVSIPLLIWFLKLFAGG